MITSTEKLTTRLKVNERLKMILPWLSNPGRNLGIQAPGKSKTSELPVDNTGDDQVIPGLVGEEPGSFPSLENLLVNSGVSTPYALALGICEDNLPLLLYLTNPSPGSLLLAGDPGAGKTRLLRSALYSAAMMNSPEQLTFSIIADDPAEYSDLAEEKHCHKLANPVEAPRLIDELSAEVEKRRIDPSDQILVVAIENVTRIAQNLNLAMLTKLHHLIKHGPRMGIWIVATFSTKDIDEVDPALLDAFRTHLVGLIKDPLLADYLARFDNCPAPYLERGSQFCAANEGGWLSFWVCDPKGGVE